MRLLCVIALMGAFALGCGPGPSAPVSAVPSYPEVIGRGTFIQLEPVSSCNACERIVYTDENNVLQRKQFVLIGTADVIPDMVTIPEPIFPGNRIVITRTGDSAYTVSKEE